MQHDDEYIVITATQKAFKPRIQLRTHNEELARAFAHQHLRTTQMDVAIYNLKTGLCELALTYEQDKPQ